MVDRPETVTSKREVIITPAVTKQVLGIEDTVSTNDTIIMGDLTTVNGAGLLKRSDGSTVTCTVATNVITITQAALTDVVIVGTVVGV